MPLRSFFSTQVKEVCLVDFKVRSSLLLKYVHQAVTQQDTWRTGVGGVRALAAIHTATSQTIMFGINPVGRNHLSCQQLHQPSQETKHRDEVEAAQQKLLFCSPAGEEDFTNSNRLK